MKDKFGSFTPTLVYGTGNAASGGNIASNVASMGPVYADGPLSLSSSMVSNTADKGTKSDSSCQSIGGAPVLGALLLALNHPNLEAFSGSNTAGLSTTGLGGSHELGNGLTTNLALYTIKNNKEGGTLTNLTAGVAHVMDKQWTLYGQVGSARTSSSGFDTASYGMDANGTFAAMVDKTTETLYLGTKVIF